MKRNTFVAVLVNIALTLTLFAQTTFAQESDRVIKKMSWRSEPVKILKLKTKNKSIELGRKFSEEEDWLNGFTVSVQNISSKAIARIELGLAFPPPQGSPSEKPHLVIRMGFGREPDLSRATDVQKLVLSGESVEIKLPEANLSAIKQGLEQLGYPEEITKAEISVKSVTFVDGSEWTGDEMLYPDPSDPTKKINPNRPLPEKSQPSEAPIVRLDPVAFRFLNAGAKHAHAPLRRGGVSKTRSVLPQLPERSPSRRPFALEINRPL